MRTAILLAATGALALSGCVGQVSRFDGEGPIARAGVLDAARDALWVVGREPLAAIECVRLSDGEAICRVPLPIELESRDVRIVLSGKNVAVYAPDRHIAAALLLVPERGFALPLL